MRRSPRSLRLVVAGCLGLSALALSAPARAQEHTLTLAVYGGLGGSIDKGGDLGNAAFQLGLGLLTEARAQVWGRLGTFDFSTGDRPGDIADATMTYLNVGGEYRFSEGYYDSGIYLGLGAYNMDGDRGDGRQVDATEPGLVIGLIGEFEVSRQFVVMIDLAGHFMDSDDSRYFATALVGFGWHF